MCNNIAINDRQTIINKFSIPARKSVYPTLYDAIKDALKFAFRDINFRTLHQKSDEYPILDGSQDITSFLIEKNEFYIKKFERYFQHGFLNETDFDEWHHEACALFLHVLRRYYPDAKYGKAQKIVNMTFKHLYCMNIKELGGFANDQYFEHCHLTLDSFTLDWFFREVVDNWHDYLGATYGKQITDGRKDSWSNLCYSNNTKKCRGARVICYSKDPSSRVEKDEKYHYMFFIDMVREFFPSTNPKLESPEKFTPEQLYYKDLTPFQAEFYIWPEIQLHQTAEALFGQSIEMERTIDNLQNELKQESFYASVISHINHSTVSKNKRDNNKKKINDFRDYDPDKSLDTYNREKVAKEIFKQLPLDAKMAILEEKIKLLKDYSKR